MTHPLILKARALAHTRAWPLVWGLAREASFSLGEKTRLTVNAPQRGALLVSVSFHLTPAALESLEDLASEIGGRLMDAALAVAPQRLVEGSRVD